jgi:serine/threonine-protein kinase DCLK2
MNKKVNVNDQLSRMKGLMNYGLKTESKNSTYSSVEYQKLGADGNVYGIIREGAKYYIEKAANKKNLVKEDFNYIGGFKNRKDYEYSSFASAQKNFDLKMMSLREAYANGKNIVIESWNPDKKESLTVEATDKMRNEILRERQIMNNAARINESKPQVMFTEDDKTCGVCGSKECKCEDPAKSADIEGYENLKDANPKKSFRQSKHSTGKAKEANDYKPVKESAEVLGWHQTGQDAKGNMADTYMDKTHGTEVGDSAPFDEEPVEEGTSMHSEGENQNNPTVGSNKIGDGAPFDKSGKVNEDVDDDMSDEDETYFEPKEDLEEPVDDDTELDKPEEGLEDSPEDEGDDEEEFGSDLDDDDSDDDDEFENDEDLDDDEDEFDEDDLESRVENIEDTLEQIANKLGIDTNDIDTDEFEDDDDLYSDDDSDDNDDEFDDEDELATESRRNRGYKIYESRAFRKAKRAMNEDGMKPFSNKNRVPQDNLNALDEFGKHPAYRKQPMTVPTHNHQEFDGYYDMSDESARNNTPFGTNIGNGAPFELDTEKVNKSIAESIRRNLRMLKKKSNRK